MPVIVDRKPPGHQTPSLISNPTVRRRGKNVAVAVPNPPLRNTVAARDSTPETHCRLLTERVNRALMPGTGGYPAAMAPRDMILRRQDTRRRGRNGPGR